MWSPSHWRFQWRHPSSFLCLISFPRYNGIVFDRLCVWMCNKVGVRVVGGHRGMSLFSSVLPFATMELVRISRCYSVLFVLLFGSLCPLASLLFMVYLRENWAAKGRKLSRGWCGVVCYREWFGEEVTCVKNDNGERKRERVKLKLVFFFFFFFNFLFDNNLTFQRKKENCFLVIIFFALK